MIKELIKIANDLDSMGLIREADTLDLIVKKASQQSLDRKDELEQYAAKDVGKKLVAKLSIPMGSTLYSPLVNIGEYPSFSEWAKAQPETVVKGTFLGPLINAAKSLGPSIHGSLAVAFGVPVLASWNFSRIGKPSSKLRKKAEMKKGTLNLLDFDADHIAELLSIDSNEPKLTRVTGTPPPLVAYILIRADGDISELKELKAEGVVDSEIFNLVNKIGGSLRKKRIELKRVLNAIREITSFDDVPSI